jgi:hypothetical protein
MKLNMFRVTPPIIRILKLRWQSLVFHTRKVVGRVVGGRCQAQYEKVQSADCNFSYCAWQRPPTTRPTTFHVWKTRGCQCNFRLLMMGSVSPETCWASDKYGIIKFVTLLHLVGFFFVNCTMMHGATNIKPCSSVASWSTSRFFALHHLAALWPFSLSFTLHKRNERQDAPMSILRSTVVYSSKFFLLSHCFHSLPRYSHEMDHGRFLNIF